MLEQLEFAAVLPELYVAGLEASRQFYIDVLGFVELYSRTNPPFVFLSFQGRGQLMLQQVQENDEWITGNLQYPFGRGINFQIDTEDVQRLHDNVVSRGFPLVRGLQDSWYRGGDMLFGCREFIVQDPDGYMLRFSQSLGRKYADASFAD